MNQVDALAALSALAHSARMDVFRQLVRSDSYEAGQGGMTPGELVQTLGLPAPTLSFHLKELSRAGLVHKERRGRSLIYTPDLAGVRALADFLLEDCCRAPVQPGAGAEREETHP